jgi:hypothetical protein
LAELFGVYLYVIFPLKYFVAQERESMVDALGMVSSTAVPLTAVDESEVPGILPDADILIAFEPSVLWLTDTVPSTAFTQDPSVIVSTLDSLVFDPLIVMENVP